MIYRKKKNKDALYDHRSFNSPCPLMLRLTIGCLNGVTERLLVTVFYNFVVFFGCRGGECVSNKQMSGKQKILCCGVKLFLVACQFLGGKARAHGTLKLWTELSSS